MIEIENHLIAGREVNYLSLGKVQETVNHAVFSHFGEVTLDVI